MSRWKLFPFLSRLRRRVACMGEAPTSPFRPYESRTSDIGERPCKVSQVPEVRCKCSSVCINLRPLFILRHLRESACMKNKAVAGSKYKEYGRSLQPLARSLFSRRFFRWNIATGSVRKFENTKKSPVMSEIRSIKALFLKGITPA